MVKTPERLMTTAATTVSPRHPDRLFIDGRWVAPALAGHIDVVSPSDDRVFATVAEASAQDMNDAVAAARRAFDSGAWPALSAVQRAELLGKMGDALALRSGEVAAVMETVGAVLGQVAAQEARAIAVTTAARTPVCGK